MAGALIALRAAGRCALAAALVATLAWTLVELAPGATAERAAEAAGLLRGDELADPAARRAIVAEVEAAHRLDRPLGARVLRYLGGAALGDLGASWRGSEPVTSLLARAGPATALACALALALAIAAGIAAAVLATRRRGRPVDAALAALAALALATPPVWLALVLARLLTRGAPWALFPAAGLESASALVLPVVALAAVPAAVIARHGRAALLGATRAPWAVAARARGVGEARLVGRHALRVAAPTLCALAPALVGYLLGAALVVERVFAIRGLGALTLDAAAAGDAPVVVGVAVVAAAAVALTSVLADAAAAWADPRARPEAAGGA